MDIVVRAVEPRDTLALQDIHAQTEALTGTLQMPYPTEKLWEERIGKLPAGAVGLVAEVEGQVVGHATLYPVSSSPRTRHAASLGIVVHRDWQCQGVGSSLLTALLEVADDWLNLQRVELTVFTDNDAAISLYEKFGFEIEGTHRNYAFRNGDFADTYTMARVR